MNKIFVLPPFAPNSCEFYLCYKPQGVGVYFTFMNAIKFAD